jgi:hypothetical protein
MRIFFTALFTLLPLAAQGAWIVKSEFQLHLSEKLFDEIIADFWQSLQGKQIIPIDNFVISPAGIPIRLSGIRAEVNYSFPLPKRVAGQTREWELSSDNLSGRLVVDHISATQTIVREENGIIIEIPLRADCYNVALTLPAGSTRVNARIKADIVDNQVKLSLPQYEADWLPNSWQVESMNCSGLEGLEAVVKSEALKALSSFQNFDAEVRTALTENFETWSKDASLLLLSEREIPSYKDYLKIFYEPISAEEVGTGLLLRGEMRFEYPYVAPGQEIVHEYFLKPTQKKNPTAAPQLLIPFETVRSLMMGEYFVGKLEHSLRSTEIPAFTNFMKSRWQQFWAWPELMNYPANAKFAFQFLPMGPPSFTNEKAGKNNSISGNLDMPLSVRMFARQNGQFTPMVEFRTMVAGPTTLTLLRGGKIELQLMAEEYPVTYQWAEKYLRTYNPSTRVAADTIAEQVRNTLRTEGFTMALPALSVGKNLRLLPEKWNLENGGNLRLDFTAKK